MQQVEFGISFKVSPDLSKHSREGKDFFEVEPVLLQISNVALGRIEIDAESYPGEWASQDRNLPAGPLNVRFIETDEGVEVARDTWPLSVRLRMVDLPAGQVDEYSAFMISQGSRTFEALRAYEEEDSVKKGCVDLVFGTWRELNDRRQLVSSAFPQNPDPFPGLDFVILRGGQRIENSPDIVKGFIRSSLGKTNAFIIPPDPLEKPHFRGPGIEDLNLNVRTYNALMRHNISTISELLSWSLGELQSIRNFRPELLDEITDRLYEYGVRPIIPISPMGQESATDYPKQ